MSWAVTLASALLSPLAPFSRPPRLSVPLMYPIAESSRVGLAAVDKCWKRYPSLKHHSFAYGKCASWRARSAHCWRGEEDDTRAVARSSRDAAADRRLTTETHGERTVWLDWTLACTNAIRHLNSINPKLRRDIIWAAFYTRWCVWYALSNRIISWL